MVKGFCHIFDSVRQDLTTNCDIISFIELHSTYSNLMYANIFELSSIPPADWLSL